MKTIEIENLPAGRSIARVYDSNDRLAETITGTLADVLAALRRLHADALRGGRAYVSRLRNAT
jgi:20S proteasome alpha/beta subunit